MKKRNVHIQGQIILSCKTQHKRNVHLQTGSSHKAAAHSFCNWQGNYSSNTLPRASVPLYITARTIKKNTTHHNHLSALQYAIYKLGIVKENNQSLCVLKTYGDIQRSAHWHFWGEVSSCTGPMKQEAFRIRRI